MAKVGMTIILEYVMSCYALPFTRGFIHETIVKVRMTIIIEYFSIGQEDKI
jgi:hypothetical protein